MHLAMMRATHLVETRAWDSEFASWDIDCSGLETMVQAADLYAQGMAAVAAGADSVAFSRVHALMKMADAGEEPLARIMQHQLKAELLVIEGHMDEAVKLLERAAEHMTTLPLTYGPPEPPKPIYELLGEFYLKAGRAADAVEAFETALSRDPRRVLSLQGLMQAAVKSGNPKLARSAKDTLFEIWHSADPDVVRHMSLKW